MEAILAHSSSDPDEMLRAATLLIKRAYTEKADQLVDAIKQQRLENQNKDMETARLEDEVENLQRQLESKNERIQNIKDTNANLERDIQTLKQQLVDLDATKTRLYRFRNAIMDSLRDDETISSHQASMDDYSRRHSHIGRADYSEGSSRLPEW